MNIKLPGSTKTKTRLLIVLIILSLGIILYEYGLNIKKKNIVNEEISKEESIVPETSQSTEESTVEDVDNKEYEVSEEEKSLYNEAYVLFFSNEYEKSINKSTELISKYPENYFGYNIRGIAKAYNGNYEDGMKDIDKSLEINPEYGYARFNKALANELYNNMDEALVWYNKALEVEDYVWSYYGIASIYGRKGDVSNTMKYLNKAIELDSAVIETAKTEEDFDPVRDSEEFKSIVK